MSLYAKTLIVISTILMALIILLYFVSQSILLNSYTQLEEQAVEKNVQRVLNTVSQELNRLNIQNGDYANWDDTYRFVQDGNEDYIQSNLIDSTFTSLGINMMAFINSDGQVIYSKAINLQTEETYEIPEAVSAFFSPESPLLNIHEESTGTQGIIMVGDEPMLISSYRILTSLMEGPQMGTMIMGYMLDDAHIQHLSETLQLSLTFLSVNEVQHSTDFHTALPALQNPSAIYVNSLNERRTAGYSLLSDLSGTPVLMLRVDVARDIYEQGLASLSILLAVIVGVSLIFAIAMLILLERLVLLRLTRLSTTLSEIRDSGDLSRRTRVHGRDELATLAANINGTLEALARSQRELQTANNELEARVQSRTRELTASNQQLAEEVSQHEQTQAKLSQARDQAVEALDLKERILANISHDARTPLTVINLRTDMLKTGRYGPVNDKQIETLESIQVNSNQLLSFINELLDESQAKASTMKINSIDFQPASLLHEVSITVAPLAERKGLAFHTEMDVNLPKFLKGDPERLRQVITNLVENAIKFTDKGHVRVRLFQQDTTHWAIQVEDTGVGIPTDVQTRIFDAFWQVNSTRTQDVNHGVGLGLSIVKLISGLMGGKVTVNSQPDKGSKFTVVLPIKEQSLLSLDKTTV